MPIGGNASLANEGHDEGMEFSNGNYALLQSALDYANDTTAPSSAATGATLSNAPVGVKFTTSRGGLDLLHDRRLDADHGLHRVEAAAAA